MKVYFADAATEPGIHCGHVEHDELDLTDEELRRLKGRAVRAVTMDTAETTLPAEYRAFLDGGALNSDYRAFLRGEH